MTLRRYIGDKAFYSRLFAVMVPILIQQTITNFVGLLDNIMVGQVGTEPMSGVAIVNRLMFVYNLSIFGGLAGAGILTAQFYGKGDNKGVRDTMKIKLLFAAVAVALCLGILLCFREQLIQLFLHEGEEDLDLGLTLFHGKAYLAIMLIQTAPFALTQVYSSSLRETGETVLPMRAGITAVLVNLVFNYILIFGKLGAPALGVEGAAIATVLSRFVECGIVLIWTHRNKAKCPFAEGLYRMTPIPGALIRQVLIMGTPLLLNELLWSGGMTMLDQCYSLRGLEVVSSLNISSTVGGLFFCAFIAMGNAIAIMIGQLLGAGELERAVDEDRKLIAFSLFVSVAIGAAMALIAPLIPQIYNTTDKVRALASELLLVYAAMMPLYSYTNSCYFTLRSGGKTVITFVFDSLFVWAVKFPVAFVLSRFTQTPIVTMYLVVELLDLIKCVIGFVLVRNKTWVVDLVHER
ncbi:MAG: MATE family efflux transporter [Oscillospiraceae bacterium]|nr:MATE family efflux transporter [Oscillospiraceae bacterium]